MSEATKFIIDDFPAGELPASVRRNIDPTHRVRITVEEIPEQADKEPRYLRYWGAASHLGTTTEEAVARIRALRDEWD
ncbi:hypothetical protein [Aureimonas glaciei]|jgi:hypothetical protein|uniref:Uncharacterized protein n=1 Tax=Aureimonas glaciei TaxID=1776957 RepID=A0A917D665_9HYPH|nr:hypothetical protein [Aureimonas glaciei]GGD05524.1 hypothetical protein GCM10011335_05540 [Aureimonas glaciei]